MTLKRYWDMKAGPTLGYLVACQGADWQAWTVREVGTATAVKVTQPPIRPSINPSVHLSILPSIRPSFHRSVHPSVHPSIHWTSSQ